MIETFAKVHESIPSKLILLGDGPELIDMRHKSTRTRCGSTRTLLGKQNDVSAFYQLSDLVLLLSEKESFGLTLLETMKTGVLPLGVVRWY